MNDSPTSLDRLHDVMTPPEIPWWPPAPGWYVVAALLLIGIVVLTVRAVLIWKHNAYRRAALRELQNATDVGSIGTILRRTALAVTPRSTVAAKTGPSWPQWLDAMVPIHMPDTVRRQLSSGAYGPSENKGDLTALREYAETWIRDHRFDAKVASASHTLEKEIVVD